jgi:hypothetical protein
MAIQVLPHQTESNVDSSRRLSYTWVYSSSI